MEVRGSNLVQGTISIKRENYENRPIGFMTLESISSKPEICQELGLGQSFIIQI
jgi:hypothetical protein